MNRGLFRNPIVLAVCALLSVGRLTTICANEPAYDLESVDTYLGVKQLVFFGVRLDGGVSVSVLRSYADSVGVVIDEERAEQFSAEIRAERRQDYRILVVNEFRGGVPAIVVARHADADPYLLPLGEIALIFADSIDGHISFGVCDVFPLSRFARDGVDFAQLETLVARIKNERLSPCLRERSVQ
jgi:hypothetical protein